MKSAPSLHPKYRPDIDGLRAIAILLVLAFHAFPEWVGGGFIGVDIFFVISGFLISSIILSNLQNNSFSFVDFYSRRIRRIFPALMFVMLVCWLIGWDILIPSEYQLLGRHLTGGAGFFSNFILWRESGYFDEVASVKPLLHFWSLAIEEQFYIFWPMLLWGACKLKLNRGILICVFLASSFYLNISGAVGDPVATFYSPQTRFWELLSGSLLAFLFLVNVAGYKTYSEKLVQLVCGPLQISLEKVRCVCVNLIAAVGLICIVLGLIFIEEGIPYPDWWGLLPVAGAMFLIGAGSSAWVNKYILSSAPMVWVGLISYPLYLWHWPLLSFARIMHGDIPTLYTRMILVVASFFLAWITYALIEKPIRAGVLKDFKASRLFLMMCVIALLSIAITKEYLLPRSQNISALKYYDFTGYPDPPGQTIDLKYQFGSLGSGNKNIIVMLGDSHAQQYRNALESVLKQNKNVYQEPQKIMYNIPYFGPDELLKVSKEIALDGAISTVVFSNFWALTYGSNKINYAIRCCGDALGGSVGGEKFKEPPSPQQIKKVDLKLEEASSTLVRSGKRVYFILDNPFGEELAPKSMVNRNILSGVKINASSLPKKIALERAEPARSNIIAIANKTGATIIDPLVELCDEAICPALSPDGVPLYKDYDHLSLPATLKQIHYLNPLIIN